MSTPPPERLDPWQHCDRGQVVSGRVAVSDLRRLVPLLASAQGQVDYRLAFDRDCRRRAVIACRVDCVLQLTCQRCLEVIDYPVQTESTVAVVTGVEQSGQLPDELEPILIESGSLSPLELVEEELLLALPAVPRHTTDACSNTGSTGPELAKPESPFGILAKLRSSEKEK